MKMTYEEKVEFANKLRQKIGDNFDAKTRLQFWGSSSQKWQTNMYPESYAHTLYSLFVMDIPHRFIPDEDCEFQVRYITDGYENCYTYDSFELAFDKYSERDIPAVMYNRTTEKVVACKNIFTDSMYILRRYL